MQQNIAALLFYYFTRSTLEASLSCRIKCVVYFSSIFENKYILKPSYDKVSMHKDNYLYKCQSNLNILSQSLIITFRP